MRRLIVLASLVMIPVLAGAQPVPNATDTGGSGTGRNALRDRFNTASKPKEKAKLDEALRNFNADDEPSRLEGVRQLGNVEDEPKALGYLLQGANDPSSAVRLKSIDVLGQIRAKDAVAPLVQHLFMRGTDEPTKQHILVSLGKIGDPRAVQPIVDFLAREDDRRLRGNAIFALGDIGDESALAPLGQMAEETQDPTLRSVTQNAMRKIRDRPAPEVVPSALVQERQRAAAQAAQGKPSTP